MAYKRNNFNRNNKFSGNKKFPATRLGYVDEIKPGNPKGGPSDALGYEPIVGDVRLQAQVSTIRRFDETADFITRSNVTGADPLFGAPNTAHNIVYEHSTPLIVGPQNESKYLNQEYNLIGERDRNIIHYFQGIDLTQGKVSGRTSLALTAWLSYLEKLNSTLDSELYTTESRLPLRLVYADADATNKLQAGTELAARGITAQAAYEIGYHIETHMLASYLVQYKLLVAMLPKLKTRYYDLEPTFSRVEGELKRATVRAKIQALENALKRRWVHKVSLNRVAKTLGFSAATDGINSSIDSMTQFYQIMNVAVKDGTSTAGAGTTVKWEVSALFGKLFRENNAKPSVVDLGRVNMWEFETMIKAARIDKVAGKQDESKAVLQQWIDSLDKLYSYIPGWEQAARPLESLYQRLDTLQVGLQLSRDVNIAEVVDVTKWMHDKFLTGLLTMPVSDIVGSDRNGFVINVPLYRTAGMHTNSKESGFQQYYLPSDDTTVAWGKVGTVVSTTYRNAPYHQFDVEQVRGKGEGSGAIKWKVDMKNTGYTVEEASTMLMEDIPYLEITDGTKVNLLRNPNLMTMLQGSHNYNTPVIIKMLWEQTPLAIG